MVESGGKEAMMPQMTVWYSKETVTVLHLYRDCVAVDQILSENERGVNVPTGPDGKPLAQAGTRICKPCEDKFNQRETTKQRLDF